MPAVCGHGAEHASLIDPHWQVVLPYIQGPWGTTYLALGSHDQICGRDVFWAHGALDSKQPAACGERECALSDN